MTMTFPLKVLVTTVSNGETKEYELSEKVLSDANGKKITKDYEIINILNIAYSPPNFSWKFHESAF